MAERFNATVLKTVVAQVTLSSNLSPSAMKYYKFQHFAGIFYSCLQNRTKLNNSCIIFSPSLYVVCIDWFYWSGLYWQKLSG